MSDQCNVKFLSTTLGLGDFPSVLFTTMCVTKVFSRWRLILKLN